MNNHDGSQFSQSDPYTAQLTKQFKRIDQIIKNNGTVKLDLTENDRSISLTINHSRVVEGDLPIDVRASRKTRSPFDKNGLTTRPAETFSFDIVDINRHVSTDDIEAQINKHSVEKERGRLKPKSRSMSHTAAFVAPGLPNPAIRYIGDNWLLAEDCVYGTNDGFMITAKSGFKTDLSSIPRLFWALIASFELSITAPVFHDLIYRSAGEVAPPDGEVTPAGKIFTRHEADDIFLELMTRAKIPYWKRNVAYLAVRHFAESSWRKLRID
jgi:hypothetical protein